MSFYRTSNPNCGGKGCQGSGRINPIHPSPTKTLNLAAPGSTMSTMSRSSPLRRIDRSPLRIRSVPSGSPWLHPGTSVAPEDPWPPSRPVRVPRLRWGGPGGRARRNVSAWVSSPNGQGLAEGVNQTVRKFPPLGKNNHYVAMSHYVCEQGPLVNQNGSPSPKTTSLPCRLSK